MVQQRTYESGRPQQLRSEFSKETDGTMIFAFAYAEPRTAPAKAVFVAGRIACAMWMEDPLHAGLEGAMTQ
jgi:hypothetical protein